MATTRSDSVKPIAYSLLFLFPIITQAADDPPAKLERFVAVDNVCAWPNLCKLPDGTLVATIFNQPSHGRLEGDVECWASSDGRFWTKRGTPAPHESQNNRMNVAAGLASNGDLVVLASGWTLKPPTEPGGPLELGQVRRTSVSRSTDGGRHWQMTTDAFPDAQPEWTNFIPFGDVNIAADGSLRATAYANHYPLESKTTNVWLFRSDDDGRTWRQMSLIAEQHNETALLHLGGGHWLAAARQRAGRAAVDLYRSDDDGASWRKDQQVTAASQHPAHLLRLADRRLLIVSGDRNKGQFGVVARISSDEGRTWSKSITLVDDLVSFDGGYPSSAQLADGRIVTVYYSNGTAAHGRYHMGALIWSAPESVTPAAKSP